VGKDVLVKVEPQEVGQLRSMWLRYQTAKWGWHIVVPVGLATIAAGLLNWAWTVLGQDEYAAAMLLTLLFLIIGIGASIAITKTVLRWLAIVVVVVTAIYSGAVIYRKKGDKPWTSLSARGKQMEIFDEFGYLAPANDPYVMDECAEHIPEDAFRIYLGDTTFWASQQRLASGLYPVVSGTLTDGSHPPVLSIEKSADGYVYLTANVMLPDGRFAVKIDRNNFVRNPHTTWYQKREDQSTLAVYGDSNQEILYVRYLNPRALRIRGQFNYPGRFTLIITDTSMQVPALKQTLSRSCGNPLAGGVLF